MNYFIYLIPAGIANIAPIIVKKINLFDYPVDANKLFYGQPLFGRNKTFRGFVFGSIFAAIVSQLTLGNLKFGFFTGLLALLGDLIGSFMKRRLEIKPGDMCIPLDQIDWSILPLLHCIQAQIVTPIQALIMFICATLIHPLVNLLGFYMKLKPNKF